MAHQAVPNTAEAKLVFSLDSGPEINTSVHVRDNVNPWDGAALSDLADAVHDWHTGELAALQVAALNLVRIECRDLEPAFGFKFTKEVGDAGTRAGTTAPGAICALPKWTGDPGSPPRHVVKRFPGVAEADIDGNLLTQTYADDVAAAFDALRTNSLFHVSWALVIVSRFEGSELAPADSKGRVKLKPIPRDPAITNTIGDTTCPRRYGVVKSRRPSPF